MAINDSIDTAAAIEVEIVYALLSRQVLTKIRVPSGTTLEQAIQLSGIMKQFPEIDLSKNRIGVFGRLAKRDALVESRDRVEIYRPLLIDPKEARRLRVSGNKIRK
ncbi:MAG: RnfH family protein [Nitrosomonas sp.]|nr:RnfH family protein [Nitrosomonas sp.]MCW5606457.1 RnfH family protein [Nitrosomonas sp.]